MTFTFTIRISRRFSSAREFQMGNFQKYWSQSVGQDFIVLDFFVGGGERAGGKGVCGEINVSRAWDPVHAGDKALRWRLPRKGGGLTGMITALKDYHFCQGKCGLIIQVICPMVQQLLSTILQLYCYLHEQFEIKWNGERNISIMLWQDVWLQATGISNSSFLTWWSLVVVFCIFIPFVFVTS